MLRFDDDGFRSLSPTSSDFETASKESSRAPTPCNTVPLGYQFLIEREKAFDETHPVDEPPSDPLDQLIFAANRVFDDKPDPLAPWTLNETLNTHPVPRSVDPKDTIKLAARMLPDHIAAELVISKESPASYMKVEPDFDSKTNTKTDSEPKVVIKLPTYKLLDLPDTTNYFE